ncbi:glycosyltransferase [Dermabacteraceae bacterium P13147]
MDIPLHVILVDAGGRGWGPVTHGAKLIADTLGAEFSRVAVKETYPRSVQIRSLLPRLRGKKRDVLLIAPHPGGLYAAAETVGPGVRQLFGWVIDSFWWERMPRIARPISPRLRRFDRLYVTDKQDIPAWESAFGGPVSCLPWGADVAGALARNTEKTVDLTRVGRQPEAWDDDAVTAEDAAAAGVSFAGRPPFGTSDDDSDPLFAAYARTRAVLAFNNLLSPAGYTHPTRSYLTGRWTDAYAHGALVAGVAPDTPTTRELVPDWMRIDLSPTDRAASLRTVREALAQSDTELSSRIQLHAAEHLDWRARATVLAKDFSRSADSAVAAHEAVVAAARKNLNDTAN